MHGCLAWEGLHRCRANSAVLLDDVEDGAIIEIFDTNEIAHMLFPVHAPLALSCHKDTGEMALVFVRPLLPNARARVEESCHARAYGSDSIRGGGLHHRPNYGIAESLAWYLRAPTIGSGNTTPQLTLLTSDINHDRPN